MTKNEFKQEALQRWATSYHAHMSVVSAVALLSDKAAELFEENATLIRHAGFEAARKGNFVACIGCGAIGTAEWLCGHCEDPPMFVCEP